MFQVLDDWKYVARVIDRLLLYLFLLVTVFGTAVLLMQAPHILEYVDQDDIIQKIIQKWQVEATWTLGTPAMFVLFLDLSNARQSVDTQTESREKTTTLRRSKLC